jgi:hypothetical protein
MQLRRRLAQPLYCDVGCERASAAMQTHNRLDIQIAALVAMTDSAVDRRQALSARLRKSPPCAPSAA